MRKESGKLGEIETRGPRKLTRRKGTPAGKKENTLVRYKGYSRFCNRVIFRNPLFRSRPLASPPFSGRMSINRNQCSTEPLAGIFTGTKNYS